jgi:hypothetical protein
MPGCGRCRGLEEVSLLPSTGVTVQVGVWAVESTVHVSTAACT